MAKKFILRNVAMLLCLAMLITSTAQTTYGFISVASEPLVNTFIPDEYVPPVDPGTDSVKITVKKTVQNTGSGNMGPAGFSFALLEDGAPGTEALTAVSDANGNAEFELSFDKDDIGEKKYNLSEINDGKPGVEYSSENYDILVSVTENSEGKIEAKIKNGEEFFDSMEYSFTNIYSGSAVYATVTAQKAFSSESKEHPLSGFVFDLSGKKETSGPDGKAVFNLEFTEAGTYSYVLSETNTGEEGMEYDTHTRNIEIVVTDNNGVLSAEITGVTGLSVTETFTNTFTGTVTPPPVTGKVDFIVNVEVSIANDTDPPTDLDQFYIVGPNGIIKETDENGKTSFHIEETGEIGDVYTYTIKQIEGDIDDLRYDPNEYVITVEFVDDGNGNAVPVVKINGSVEPDLDDITVHFVNRYPGIGEVFAVLDVEKIIDNKSGAEIPENVDFSFRLTDKDSGEVIDTVTIIGQGKKPFAQLSFKKEDIGTHNYTITEVKGSAEGFEYSEEVHEVSILVGQNSNGDLFTVVTMDGKPNSLASFTNVYNGPDPEAVKLPITIIKEVVCGEEKIGPEQFEFVIENLSDGTSRKVRTNAEGVFSDYLEFDADDAGKTIEYRVKEVTGGRNDVIYDKSVYNFSVNVKEVGNVLETSVSMNGFAHSNNLTFTFRNVYKGTPVVPPSGDDSGIVPIIINKTVISGGDKQMGPADFEFVLEHIESGSEENYTERTRTNVEGDASFELYFSEEDIGKTFNYKVYETDEGVEGVEYDKTVYDITLTVYKDDLGDIAAKGEVKGGEKTEQINTGVTGIFGKEDESDDVPSMNVVLKFVNKYDVSDEGNPETGIYMIAEGICAMIFSGFMFVLLVLTDKRFKFKG